MSLEAQHAHLLAVEAERAVQFSRDCMVQFHAACARGDWWMAERERNNIVGATEVYLDRLMLFSQMMNRNTH